MADLTQARLKELFWYKPLTGVFIRRRFKGKHPAGSVAGYLSPDGYIRIKIDGNGWLAHRLAHLYMTGEWPADDVDHADHDRANNRWKNIRAATTTQNLGNMTPRKGKILPKGVRSMSGSRYQARLTCAGKVWHLGTFATLAEAHEAYKEAAEKHFGEFAFHG